MTITISPAVIGMVAIVAAPQTTTTIAVRVIALTAPSAPLSVRIQTATVVYQATKVTGTVTTATTTVVVTGMAVTVVAAATTTTTAASVDASTQNTPAPDVTRCVDIQPGLEMDTVMMTTTIVAAPGTLAIAVVRRESPSSMTTAVTASV